LLLAFSFWPLALSLPSIVLTLKEPTFVSLIKFILNNKEVKTDLPSGSLLLDFIRYHQQLKGTRIGCREGDCGACTILVGELKNNELVYRSFTSCLTPLGNVQGKHVVTIEGINGEDLNFVQQAMLEESATQCGFCTPGFVVSFTGFCLNKNKVDTSGVIASVDGNICRCTGYKSIERAAQRVTDFLWNRKEKDAIEFAVEQQLVPAYFSGIKERLTVLSLSLNGGEEEQKANRQVVSGGTDVYVQKPDEMKEAGIDFLFNRPGLKSIGKEDNRCLIGPSATVTDLSESAIMQEYFPHLKKYIRLVSSTPIRNMATIAGNFINASPIGDLTIFFLALDAQLLLNDGKQSRELPLRQLYKGYKTLDKTPDEYVEKIWFTLPDTNTLFNFEKVSKRTHLDIASVNTAMSITMDKEIISNAGISAGGVGPVPEYLKKTSEFLKGKLLHEELVAEATEIAQAEINPISDTRGSALYKRLLLSQLIKAHFITLFPDLKAERMLKL
jgi:xanthine dehydrogenase small subunit